MKHGLLLFAHGARDPRWAQPFEQIAARLRAARPTQPVCLAFLEIMTPDIHVAGADLVAQGCAEIDILPLFLGAGGHTRKDLPPLLDTLRATHPSVTFNLYPAIGEAPALIAAIAEHALTLHRR